MLKTTEKPWKWLCAGLLAFACLGLEALVLLLEGIWYGNTDFRQWDSLQMFVHWLAVSILWCAAAGLLCAWAKKQGLAEHNGAQSPKAPAVLAAFLLAAICAGASAISWGGFKPLMEYRSLSEHFYGAGVPAFVFQYLYYLAESALILLLIVFGQRWGEAAFRFKNTALVPWGGLLCGLTWGLAHMYTQSLGTGLALWAVTVLYGAAYLLLRKNIRWAYAAVAAMFLL